MLFFNFSFHKPRKPEGKYKVTLNLNPCSMRCGIPSLTAEAMLYGIDLTKCRDVMIFVSKSRKILKLVWYDNKGPFMLTRVLRHGGYQRLLDRVNGNGTKELTYAELELYIDGDRIMVKPEAC